MKILMVYPFEKIGGVETWIKEVSKRLEKNGHEVTFSQINERLKYERLKKRLYIWFKYAPPTDVDIIHLHEFSINSLKLKGRIPIVSTYHGSSWARFRLLNEKRAFFSGLLEKVRYEFSDVNIAVSREIQRWYPNSIYIPNGADPNKFKPNGKKLKIRTNKIKIILVGRLEKMDNLALKKLEKRFYVIFPTLDKIPDESMPIYYRSADVFVLPSLYEGMPLSALEAMSSGIPVVCYRVGGLPDIVFDDFNGYLVSPGDLGSLIRKIEEAYRKKDILGKNGRYLVKKIFNWNYVTKRYLEIYKNLVK